MSGSNRDDREIEAIVSAYAGVVTRAVRRVAGPRAAGIQDDVQQAVMVGIWRQLKGGQTIDRPVSYIFRAAIRETIRVLRREAVGPAVSLALVEPDTALVPSTDPDPERDLEEKERRQALLAAISSLAPKRRQAVRAHLAGWNVGEMMELFGWPYQTARHLVARGMADLRQALRDRGIHE